LCDPESESPKQAIRHGAVARFTVIEAGRAHQWPPGG
jgi:hypothetical protein